MLWNDEIRFRKELTPYDSDMTIAARQKWITRSSLLQRRRFPPLGSVAKSSGRRRRDLEWRQCTRGGNREHSWRRDSLKNTRQLTSSP